MITLRQLKEAVLWEEGFCILCLEKTDSVQSTDAEECPSCGTKTVHGASALLSLVERVEEE